MVERVKQDTLGCCFSNCFSRILKYSYRESYCSRIWFHYKICYLIRWIAFAASNVTCYCCCGHKTVQDTCLIIPFELVLQFVVIPTLSYSALLRFTTLLNKLFVDLFRTNDFIDFRLLHNRADRLLHAKLPKLNFPKISLSWLDVKNSLFVQTTIREIYRPKQLCKITNKIDPRNWTLSFVVCFLCSSLKIYSKLIILSTVTGTRASPIIKLIVAICITKPLLPRIGYSRFANKNDQNTKKMDRVTAADTGCWFIYYIEMWEVKQSLKIWNPVLCVINKTNSVPRNLNF